MKSYWGILLDVDLDMEKVEKPYCIVHNCSGCVAVKWRYKEPNIIAYICTTSGIIWHRYQ
jgi:hypothetical protein